MNKKVNESKFTADVDRGLDIQQWRNTLGFTDDYLMDRFSLSEEELKRIYYGKVTSNNMGDFQKVYFDLKHEMELHHKKSNLRAMKKILVMGDFYSKPVFYKLLRNIIGYTQEDLAKTLNVSKSAVRSWEQGKSTANGSSQTLLYQLIPVEIRNKAEKEKLGKEYSNSKIIHDNIAKDQEEDGQTYFGPAIIEETTETMIKMKNSHQ